MRERNVNQMDRIDLSDGRPCYSHHHLLRKAFLSGFGGGVILHAKKTASSYQTHPTKKCLTVIISGTLYAYSGEPLTVIEK